MNVPDGKLLTSNDVQRYIASTLQISQPDHSLLSIEDAQKVLDEVWKVLDSAALPAASTDEHFFSYRNKLRKTSLKLCMTHDILPSALILRGVQCSSPEQVGAGAFSDVFVGTFDGQKVALKRLRVYLMVAPSRRLAMKRLFYRESLLWKNLTHPHIVPFLGVAEDVFQGTVCMVLPWMNNGCLPHYIDAKRASGQLQGQEYVKAIDGWLYHIAQGLVYLHSEGLVHGDLHGGNVLVDNDGNARLSDFGMALVSDSTSYGYASIHGGGATRWKAPELIDPELFGKDDSRPTPSSDVFSFACMCIELYSGRPPMADIHENSIIRRYVQGERPPRPELPDGGTMSSAVWDLTTSCWDQLASNRPSSQEVAARMALIIGQPAAVVKEEFPALPSEIATQFRVVNFIKKGSRSMIFEGIHLITSQVVVLKFETTKVYEEYSELRNESRVYRILKGRPGVVQMHYFGRAGDRNVLILEMLGPNLEELFELCGRKFTVKTVCMVMKRLITLVQTMHENHLIHRDIGPSSFLIPRPGLKFQLSSDQEIRQPGQNSQISPRYAAMLHIIGFGRAKQYRNPNNRQHIPYREKKLIVGRAKYMSTNAHMGRELSRRDDLESLGYMCLEFLRGDLSWQALDRQQMGEKKQAMPVDNVFKEFDKEFSIYMEYVRKLQFDEVPDYEFLREMLTKVMRVHGVVDDGVYDWHLLNVADEGQVSQCSHQ